MTNVDRENGDNSETTTVLSAHVMLYPNFTNSKIRTKHTLPVQISQLHCAKLFPMQSVGHSPPLPLPGWETGVSSPTHKQTRRFKCLCFQDINPP